MQANNHKRVLKIGNKLIEGPSLIINKGNGDWLEKDMVFVLHDPESGKLESYSIWSDNTMNKQSGFLPPMIRIVTWDKRKDLEALEKDTTRRFPKVDLKLGTIASEAYRALDDNYIQLQQTVMKAHTFIPFKIGAERNSPKLQVDYGKEYFYFSVRFNNGNQIFRFESYANVSDELLKNLLEMKNQLLNAMESVDLSNWKERHYELTNDYLEGNIPEWHYHDEIISNPTSKRIG